MRLDTESSHTAVSACIGWGGLLPDPGEVVGIAIGDRSRRNARYHVRVLTLGPGDNFGYSTLDSVQRYAPLGAFVNLTLPSVDRMHWVEIMGACAEAVFD